MKKNDIKLIVVIVLITCFISLAFYFCNNFDTSDNKNSKLVVSIAGKTKKYVINEDKVIILENKIKIQVKDKKVKVLSSPCKNKICIKRGFIDNIDENITCLPCKTIIYFEKNSDKKDKKFDSLVE